MTPDRADLLEAIDQLHPTPWGGTTFRFTTPDRDPLSGEGARRYGGRWNPPEAFPTLYLAEPREACIAEFYRRAEGQGRGAASLLPQLLHTIRVNDLEVLDLTREDHRDVVGVTVDDISSDDPTACQQIGAGAYFLGYQGVFAPSATSTGFVIAAFERSDNPPGQIELIDSEELDLP